MKLSHIQQLALDTLRWMGPLGLSSVKHYVLPVMCDSIWTALSAGPIEYRDPSGMLLGWLGGRGASDLKIVGDQGWVTISRMTLGHPVLPEEIPDGISLLHYNQHRRVLDWFLQGKLHRKTGRTTVLSLYGFLCCLKHSHATWKHYDHISDAFLNFQPFHSALCKLTGSRMPPPCIGHSLKEEGVYYGVLAPVPTVVEIHQLLEGLVLPTFRAPYSGSDLEAPISLEWLTNFFGDRLDPYAGYPSCYEMLVRED